MIKVAKKYKVSLIFAALIAAVYIGIVLRLNYWQSNPDRAFEHFTGRAIPPGMHATAYSWETNDNLFHFSHYFLLTGSPSSLRRFTSGTGLVESTEDARWVLPDINYLFGRSLSKEQLVVGYEDDSPRNNWYWIFSGESEAIYVQN
jgi:hypothetical protein